MNISDRDLIQLRKDIERVRKHEEARRARQTGEKPSESTSTDEVDKETMVQPSVPVTVRLRQLLEGLFASTTSSNESREAIPDHIVILLQVIEEEPKFQRWLLAIDALSDKARNEQLRRMSYAMRIEDEHSSVADSFDRLQDPNLFKAFCQALRDDRKVE